MTQIEKIGQINDIVLNEVNECLRIIQRLIDGLQSDYNALSVTVSNIETDAIVGDATDTTDDLIALGENANEMAYMLSLM